MFITIIITIIILIFVTIKMPHLESWRNVEGGIHPAVAVQNSLVHTAISLYITDKSNEQQNIIILCIPLYQVTLDGFPEELFGGGHEGAGEEDGGGDLVKTFERPVVDGYLVDLKINLNLQQWSHHGHLEEELCSGGHSAQNLGHVGTETDNME